jgi:hypothetical protein
MNNNKFPSDSEDLILPPKVEYLIKEVNINCEQTKENMDKIKKFTLTRDIKLKLLLSSLNELQRICHEDLRDADNWNLKSFDELVTKPINELKEIAISLRDDSSTSSPITFEKIYELTQKIINRIRAFKFSSLKHKRDLLNSLFRLPNAEKE